MLVCHTPCFHHLALSIIIHSIFLALMLLVGGMLFRVSGLLFLLLMVLMKRQAAKHGSTQRIFLPPCVFFVGVALCSECSNLLILIH